MIYDIMKIAKLADRITFIVSLLSAIMNEFSLHSESSNPTVFIASLF